MRQRDQIFSRAGQREMTNTTKRLIFAAILGLLVTSAASAETIVDYSFSGAVSGYGIAPGTIARASGQLLFSQTGQNVTPESFFPIITGVPGYYAGGYIGLVAYDQWNIAPDGDLISGAVETGNGDEGVPSFVLSRTADGAGYGSFVFYVDNIFPEYFSSTDVAFTQIDPISPVPEPVSLAVFASGLLGLILMKWRHRHIPACL